jgi:hypothetical protein
MFFLVTREQVAAQPEVTGFFGLAVIVIGTAAPRTSAETVG